MNESEKLELRRQTWEALGWRRVDLIYKMVWRGRLDGEQPYDESNSPCYAEQAELAPIESSNGIAMDELMKFCDRLEGLHCWEIRTANPGEFCCIIGKDVPEEAVEDVSEYGETPAIAICKAICEARKK